MFESGEGYILWATALYEKRLRQAEKRGDRCVDLYYACCIVTR